MPPSLREENDLEAARATIRAQLASQIKANDPNDRTAVLKGKDAAARLFQYATDQRIDEKGPWFPEFGILHRLNIADINNKLAECKKEIYDFRSASDAQMANLRTLLTEQATAIRNFQYIQSQESHEDEYLGELEQEITKYFPEFAASSERRSPYDSETYRSLAHPPTPHAHNDPLRDFLCNNLPARFTYSAAEKKRRHVDYDNNIVPIDVSPQIEKLARLLIAFFGAISILVPMIIMSLDPSKTKSLVTTSVAVLVFAFIISLTLQTANDQTLAATAGYAGVLMVFVGLTS